MPFDRSAQARASERHETRAEPRPGDACPSCGPSYKLLLRDLARCGRKGPGEGAYCAVCRGVWALPVGAAPAL